MAKNKSQYDSTLNLPKTLFEMRAGLPKKEPVMLKDWDDNDLYNQLMKHNEGKTSVHPARRPSVCQRQYPHGYGPEQDHQGHHHPL